MRSLLLALCVGVEAFAPARLAFAPARATVTRVRSDPRNLSPEQMEQAKQAFQAMTPDDMEAMARQMDSLTPEQKEDMKRQGMNPGMMEMMAKMARKNPDMLKQAQRMMGEMSPEALEQATKTAQAQVSSMSPAEMEKMADQMAKSGGTTGFGVPDGSPQQMEQAAKAFQSMTPDDMQRMVGEMASLTPEQKAQMKAQGLDPGMMEMMAKMAKNNPDGLKQAQEMMASMSPAQIEEATKAAAKQMGNMSPEEMEKMASVMATAPPPAAPAAVAPAPAPAAAPAVVVDVDDEYEPDPEDPAGTAYDPEVISTLFKVACYCSDPPGPDATFDAFCRLPPIAALMGPLDDDLTTDELAGAWAEAATSTAARLSRKGFETAWLAVDEMYDGELLGNARRAVRPKGGKRK